MYRRRYCRTTATLFMSTERVNVHHSDSIRIAF